MSEKTDSTATGSWMDYERTWVNAPLAKEDAPKGGVVLKEELMETR